MAKVLLTGASGFVGGHLMRELLGHGHQVTALSRSENADRIIQAGGARAVRGGLSDQAALNWAAEGMDAVFHCAANTSTWSRDKAAQMDTNVGGTQRLLSAATRAGVPCFVHTSSVSAFSHLIDEPLLETLTQRGGDSWVNYERSKFLGEQAVRQSGLPYLIFNPSHVLGPGDTQNWARLIMMVDQDRLPGVPPGSGAFADVREIAKAQVTAWQSGVRNEAFLLGGKHVSFLHLVQAIAVLCHRKPPVRVMPATLLKAVGHISQAASYITGRMPQITPASVAITCHRLQVDSTKAKMLLGYRETDLQRLLEDTLDWMRAEAMIRPKPV